MLSTLSQETACGQIKGKDAFKTLTSSKMRVGFFRVPIARKA